MIVVLKSISNMEIWVSIDPNWYVLYADFFFNNHEFMREQNDNSIEARESANRESIGVHWYIDRSKDCMCAATVKPPALSYM